MSIVPRTAGSAVTDATAETASATSADSTPADHDNTAYCPQCALRALQAELTPERIEAQARAMKAQEGITTPPAEYERRLAICERCDRLQGDVLCADCGSYVVYRARLIAATCPYPGGSKWTDIILQESNNER